MPFIRIELASDRQRAKKFHHQAARGASFPQEKELVLQEVWAKGYTPTGTVHYRGMSNEQPPSLKFDAEVTLN